jgi:uncharacterized DUF497 family protein
MRFEFDENKSRSNEVKHGVDFVEAQRLWDDPDLLEIPARTIDEPRYLLIGRMDGKHWSAVVTYRGEDHPHHICPACPGRGGSAL